jgi:hypothetical protein
MNAENSMGFHAPAGSLRLLGESIDSARQGVTEEAKLKLLVKSADASQTAPKTRGNSLLGARRFPRDSCKNYHFVLHQDTLTCNLCMVFTRLCELH